MRSVKVVQTFELLAFVVLIVLSADTADAQYVRCCHVDLRAFCRCGGPAGHLSRTARLACPYVVIAPTSGGCGGSVGHR
jgi:hypothetical protein